MSRIIDLLESERRSLKLGNAKATISKHFAAKIAKAKTRGKRSRIANIRKMQFEMSQVLELVVAPQISKDFRLDLSDTKISETLNVSERRSKQLRLELKAARVAWFPEWSRPKKKGDYPYWMLFKEFINFPSKTKRSFTPKTSKKYNQRWCRLYDLAKKEVFAELESLDARVTVKQFMMMVYHTVNSYIKQLGLTEAQILR